MHVSPLCFQVVSAWAKPPHQLPGLALYWWILGQELQPAARHLLKDISCTTDCPQYGAALTAFFFSYSNYKQYANSVPKLCGLKSMMVKHIYIYYKI